MHIRVSLLLTMTAAAAWAQELPIDTGRSTIAIHVGKSGLLSMAGHEHWVAAPIASGSIDETALRVNFTVETAKMMVKPDPKIDAKTEAQIQKDMQELALETAKFPEIVFRSSKIEKTGDGWRVEGSLALHGVTKSVAISVKKAGDGYSARTTLKQTDYGMKPISIGGVVKVKNELELEFQIFPRR